MEEKEFCKVTAFDSLFTTNRIQMMKILLTYLAPSNQKNLAIYIKLMELQYTISFFKQYPHASLSKLPHEESFDTMKLCDEILPLCDPAEQEKLKQLRTMFQNFENMQEMLQMIQMMQEMFPEGAPFGGGGEENGGMDFLSGLAGMDLSQLANMFQNKS